MERIQWRRASCSYKHAQYEADDLFIHSSSPLVECAAFEEACNLISPLGCTVDDKESFVNDIFLPVVVIFGTDYSQTHVLDHGLSGYPKRGTKS